jgi:hypothetical protein
VWVRLLGFRIRFELLKTKIPSLEVARHATEVLDCWQVKPTFPKRLLGGWWVLVGICHHAFALVSSKPPACTSLVRLVNLHLSIWIAITSVSSLFDLCSLSGKLIDADSAALCFAGPDLAESASFTVLGTGIGLFLTSGCGAEQLVADFVSLCRWANFFEDHARPNISCAEDEQWILLDHDAFVLWQIATLIHQTYSTEP